MQQPCQDSYCTTFGSLALMMDYHKRQSETSKWARMPVSTLRVLPLDKESMDAENLAFAESVSQTAIEDTAQNLGLAAETADGLYPVRDTAYKSLIDRAKINGTVLPKLAREDLAHVLNLCLQKHPSEALVLIRDEKISAVLAGDEKDYSILPIDALMHALTEHLEERFPGYQFDGGYSDHAITTATWKLAGQRTALLEEYDAALIAHGKSHLAGKLMPGVRFITSDVGVSCASVSALLMGVSRPIRIGSIVSVEHRRQSTVQEFEKSLDMLFAQFADTVGRIKGLLDEYLSYPVNAMIGVCKKLGLPKKAALQAIDMFETATGGDPASAHDIYMGLQEILFILKTEGVPENKLLSVEESIARALTLNWEDYDTAKAVAY